MRNSDLYRYVLAFCVVFGVYSVWRRVVELGFDSLHLKYTSLEISSSKDGSSTEYHFRTGPKKSLWGYSRNPKRTDKVIVMGKLSTENTSWVDELPEYV